MPNEFLEIGCEENVVVWRVVVHREYFYTLEGRAYKNDATK